jgi:hypothetical protein
VVAANVVGYGFPGIKGVVPSMAPELISNIDPLIPDLIALMLFSRTISLLKRLTANGGFKVDAHFRKIFDGIAVWDGLFVKAD